VNLRTVLTSLLPPAPRGAPMARPDAADVAAAVARHCRRIGCDQSNTTAAVSWALRAPGDTLNAVREGRKRAEQLLARQPPGTPPFLPHSA
jgi:hypothetical protein